MNLSAHTVRRNSRISRKKSANMSRDEIRIQPVGFEKISSSFAVKSVSLSFQLFPDS